MKMIRVIFRREYLFEDEGKPDEEIIKEAYNILDEEKDDLTARELMTVLVEKFFEADDDDDKAIGVKKSAPSHPTPSGNVSGGVEREWLTLGEAVRATEQGKSLEISGQGRGWQPLWEFLCLEEPYTMTNCPSNKELAQIVESGMMLRIAKDGHTQYEPPKNGFKKLTAAEAIALMYKGIEVQVSLAPWDESRWKVVPKTIPDDTIRDLTAHGYLLRTANTDTTSVVDLMSKAGQRNEKPVLRIVDSKVFPKLSTIDAIAELRRGTQLEISHVSSPEKGWYPLHQHFGKTEPYTKDAYLNPTVLEQLMKTGYMVRVSKKAIIDDLNRMADALDPKTKKEGQKASISPMKVLKVSDIMNKKRGRGRPRKIGFPE